MKKAFPWLGIILYLADVVSDILVGADFIERCHYNYGISVLAFIWLPGLSMGGFFSVAILKKKYGSVIGCCGMVALFILGTLLGPIILIPGTLYCLVKAAINPSSNGDNWHAKL